jgi:glutaconate CoA-transferase, subunit B
MSGELATRDERMTVAAARLLGNGVVCFVGIGLPSKAANLARATHAPDLVLIYESGPIGARPSVLPLSIGDGELAETADGVVPTHEIFRYWLQGGRVDVGFLGAAQIDRFANINTTVIGPYAKPKVRLPGAGGAPEIAAQAREVVLMLPHGKRTFVQTLDFVTSVGFHTGGRSRETLGLPGLGPKAVVTDLGVLEPDSETRELVLTAVYPGVMAAEVVAQTSWPLRVSPSLRVIDEPSRTELEALRALEARTAEAHGVRA